MTNIAIFIMGLLIAFPIIYAVGVYAFFLKIAKNNRVKFLEVVRYFKSRVTARDIAKYAAIAIVVGACVNYLLSGSEESLVVHTLIVFDMTLLVSTAVWSIIRAGDITNINEQIMNTMSFCNSQNEHNNSSSEQNIFDSDDWMYDPAYSHLPGNIYNFHYEDYIAGNPLHDLKEWMDKMRDL